MARRGYSDDPRRQRERELGLINGRRMRNWQTLPADGVIEGLAISDPNFGSLSYTVVFPYSKRRVDSHILDYLVFNSARLGELLGVHTVVCVEAARLGITIQAFTDAIDAALLPGVRVNWHYLDIPQSLEPHMNVRFRWQVVDGYMPDYAEKHSSLELTTDQVNALARGNVVDVVSDREMRCNPVRVTCGQWSGCAYFYLPTAMAMTNGTFKYQLSLTPIFW